MPGDEKARTWLRFMAAVVLILALLYLVTHGAKAHTAPSGWDYPGGCCVGVHCSPIPPEQIVRTAEGYHIIPTGETIRYAEANSSPDGEYHYCTARDRHPPPDVYEWSPVTPGDQLHKDSTTDHWSLNRSRVCFWAPEVGS